MSEELILNEEEESTGAPKWVVTFGDMMSLLLVFFVLLLSFANMDIVKFKELMGSIQNAFGVQTQNVTLINIPTGDGIMELSKEISASKEQADIKKAQEKMELLDISQEQIDSLRTNDSLELLGELEKFIEETDLEEQVAISAIPDGVLMEIKGSLMFDTGEAEIKENAIPMIKKITRVVRSSPYEVIVEGHTDNVPIRSMLFPSNWELSSARAGAVVRVLLEEEEIDHTRFCAVGYADTRPIADNDIPENRAKNRRVNFIFKTNEAQKREASKE